MRRFTIRAWNFRGLEHLEWSPDGVSLLAGPNASGKTTTLHALRFCRNSLLRGVAEAIRFSGGATAFRNLRANPDADVIFEIESGEVTWRIEVPVDGDGVHSYHGERLVRSGDVVLDVPRLQATFELKGQERQRGRRTELETLLTVEQSPWLKDFGEAVRSIRIYDDFNLYRAHAPVTADDGDAFLHPTGRNLVHVLKNWKGAPRRFDDQFEWVLDRTREAFPDVLEDIELLADRAWFYPTRAPHPDAKLPLSLGASGLITGLLQLVAVAGAKPSSLIGFDEMENQLHPHAIRVILKAMRERAEARDLTVVLTTHSPVVMNEFKGEEEHFFVLEPMSSRSIPVPLTTVRSADWLAHFSLGDLYEREEFASPRPEAP